MQLDSVSAEARLSSERNLSTRFSGHALSVVHKNFQKPVLPAFIRNTAAILGAQGGNRKEIGNSLGITGQEVSLLANGARKSDIDVESEMSKTRDLALEKLMGALGFMSKEKLEKASLKDLSNVISATARVVERTSPSNQGRDVTLVVFAPEIKQETSFKIVEV